MSSIMNKLGLGGNSSSDSSASSSSSSSTSSSSSSSTRSGTMGNTTTTNTVNKTGYADSSDYASTQPITAQTTTTTRTTMAGNTMAGNTYGTSGSMYGSGTAAATSTTAANDGYMTRSEERLLVGKEQVSAGVANLNKYVTTEHVQTSVPITKEHVVIEREPIAPGDKVAADIKDAHYEVALTEERAVAAKEAVPVEKVRLRKEVEHGTQNVDADLRKEHIEFGSGNEQQGNKTLGAAPGTAVNSSTTTKTYNNKPTNTAGSTNIDPIANPRV